MVKRKHEQEKLAVPEASNDNASAKVAKTNGHIDVKTPGPVIQIIAGSYERVLHGITASISNSSSTNLSVLFADSFLFNAHASAIRCLAISPLPDGASADSDVYLATGGSDERVNVYSLSSSPMPEGDRLPLMPSLGNNKISENPRNRELGTLMQHSSNITALHFPTRSKLLSASEDNTIAISRTRDLTVVSTVKAPRPIVQGQPSGDTAPPGATPAGVNDFAIHPSMKLMISVGKGERTMRLWNLVTGKKASVLNFDKHMLQAVKESKYSSGEGRKIRWNDAGTEFSVSFERGVIVFGDDAKAKCAILPQPLTKVHQIAYHTFGEQSVLMLSTEDGRVIFYDTSNVSKSSESPIPSTQALVQLGGKAAGNATRVKDFKILDIKQDDKPPSAAMIVAGSSDGAIRLWHFDHADLKQKAQKAGPAQIGTLLGTYDTGNRITCLDAFIMRPASDIGEGLSEFEGLTEAEEESSSDSEDE